MSVSAYFRSSGRFGLSIHFIPTELDHPNRIGDLNLADIHRADKALKESVSVSQALIQKRGADLAAGEGASLK
ncbi:hypothetical protein PMN64_03815 [Bradyrhizobium sp. UFLA01-814]|uniref:hypothetical protein n=1 Tax=Bradyrhizobium sp. UFLA01-814 TaxID=3023480 RepID=UPI00398AD86F